MVVYNRNKPRKHGQVMRNTFGPMRTSVSQAIRQYMYALRNPFSPDALGVRVVDSVCYPTTVSHMRYKVTCTTTATGTFQAVILPFLQASLILNAGTATGAPFVYAANPSIAYSTSASALKNTFTACRVVTWGCRIILTDSNQNAKGTYTVAPVLLGGYVPEESVLQVAAGTQAAIYSAFGVPTPSETVSAMPSAVAVNAQDLMANGELVMRGLMYSPTAYNMKPICNTGQAWVGTTAFSQAGALFTNAGAVTTYATNYLGEASGQLAYVLSVANAPASTAEFQLEFVYHLEAVPQPQTSVVMTSTPSPAGSTSAVESVLSSLNSAGEYFAIGTNVANAAMSLGTRMYGFNRALRTRAQIVD